MVRHTGLIMAVLLLCLISLVPSIEARDDMAEAEKVAKSYMTALFNGDVQTAANLTHTRTLAGLKQKYLSDLDRATREGREREFLRDTGVEASARELRAMSARELYVALMEGSLEMGGGRNRPRGTAQVTVEGSKKTGGSQVIVSMKAVIPTEKGSVRKTGDLLLSKEGSEWRVMSTRK